jgi:tRNA dimethylallyltransferase
MKKIYAVFGPTAVGKTKFAIDLAKKVDGVIINFDSMQVYDKLKIGTALPSEEEFSLADHRLFSFVDPFLNYDVSKYKKNAIDEISKIHSSGKPVILVGGTGLYLNSIIYDLEFETQKEDGSKEYVQTLYEKNGLDYIYSILERVDPTSASTIHKNNVRRVIRALEIYYSTGNPKLDYRSNLNLSEHYDVEIIILEMNRLKLYARINKRVDAMLNEGLVQEVIDLKKMGLNDTYNSMRGIGYKEVLSYLDNKYDYDTMVSILKQNSRRYAKRQITWSNQYKNCLKIDLSEETIEQVLKKINIGEQ